MAMTSLQFDAAKAKREFQTNRSSDPLTLMRTEESKPKRFASAFIDAIDLLHSGLLPADLMRFLSREKWAVARTLSFESREDSVIFTVEIDPSVDASHDRFILRANSWTFTFNLLPGKNGTANSAPKPEDKRLLLL